MTTKYVGQSCLILLTAVDAWEIEIELDVKKEACRVDQIDH